MDFLKSHSISNSVLLGINMMLVYISSFLSSNINLIASVLTLVILLARNIFVIAECCVFVSLFFKAKDKKSFLHEWRKNLKGELEPKAAQSPTTNK